MIKDMTNYVKVEALIKDTLQKRGVDYRDMCKKLGMKKKNFDSLISGKRKMKSSEFLSICIFLNLKAEDFKNA